MIHFERVIRGSGDLERGFGARVKDFLFGKSPELQVGKPYEKA